MKKQSITKDIFTVVGLHGDTPFDLQKNTNNLDFKIEGDKNSGLIQLDSIYIADPFVWIENKVEYLFFELLLATGKGVIGRAERKNENENWSNFSIVLEENFHLSYPLIFSTNGKKYMTVESGEADEVRIYESTDDSLKRWEYKKGLLSGKHYDPTIFLFENHWYMFTCTKLDFSVTNLYYSKDGILGEWLPHPKSPIVTNDAGSARPAGPVLDWGSKKYRLAQDCSKRYGAAVKVFEIIKLSQKDYIEKEYGVILSSGDLGWNNFGMHHLQVYKNNGRQVFAVSDGYDKI